MRGVISWAAVAIGLSAAWPAAAAARELAVTIYSSDVALVQDHRTIDLTGGRQRLELTIPARTQETIRYRTEQRAVAHH
jgi:hypothetical protein